MLAYSMYIIFISSTIKLKTFDSAQALELGCITAGQFHLKVLGAERVEAAAFQALSSPYGTVKMLELWGLNDRHCERLQCIPSLTSLTVVRAPFTGATLKRHSNITKLRLVACLSLTATGLKHMLVTALPGLSEIRFDSAEDQVPFDGHSMIPPTDVLQSLPFGQNLQQINLWGISALTEQHIHELQWAFHRQQVYGKARPSVRIFLPRFNQDESPASVLLRDDIHVPAIVGNVNALRGAGLEFEWTVKSRI